MEESKPLLFDYMNHFNEIKQEKGQNSRLADEYYSQVQDSLIE